MTRIARELAAATAAAPFADATKTTRALAAVVLARRAVAARDGSVGIRAERACAVLAAAGDGSDPYSGCGGDAHLAAATLAAATESALSRGDVDAARRYAAAGTDAARRCAGRGAAARRSAATANVARERWAAGDAVGARESAAKAKAEATEGTKTGTTVGGTGTVRGTTAFAAPPSVDALAALAAAEALAAAMTDASPTDASPTDGSSGASTAAGRMVAACARASRGDAAAAEALLREVSREAASASASASATTTTPAAGAVARVLLSATLRARARRARQSRRRRRTEGWERGWEDPREGAQGFGDGERGANDGGGGGDDASTNDGGGGGVKTHHRPGVSTRRTHRNANPELDMIFSRVVRLKE